MEGPLHRNVLLGDDENTAKTDEVFWFANRANEHQVRFRSSANVFYGIDREVEKYGRESVCEVALLSDSVFQNFRSRRLLQVKMKNKFGHHSS